jgi:protein-L-isoaspartate(D-aspartate) O-methyltransferase
MPQLPPDHPAFCTRLREEFVDHLNTVGAIRSAAVDRAFRAVERHRFVPCFYRRQGNRWERVPAEGSSSPEALATVYSDVALATWLDGDQAVSSSSKPSLMARILELTALEPGMRVLEIGAGTGYNAALIAELVGSTGRVVTVEIVREVADRARIALASAGYRQVTVTVADGFEIPATGPFDRLVVSGGAADLSPLWAHKLAAGGRLVVPLEHAGVHPIVVLTHEEGHWIGSVRDWTIFIPMAGRLGGMSPRGMRRPVPGEVIRTSRLWPGFPLGETAYDLGWSRGQMSFYFYLSTRDDRLAWGPRGFGLVDGAGWAVVGDDELVSLGSSRIRRALDRYYDDWSKLGKPDLVDYRLEFVPRAENLRPPAAAWVKTRARFQEWVSLR